MTSSSVMATTSPRAARMPRLRARARPGRSSRAYRTCGAAAATTPDQVGRRVARRSVVDDDDLVGRVLEREQRAETDFQRLGAVPGGDDDAGEWRVPQEVASRLHATRLGGGRQAALVKIGVAREGRVYSIFQQVGARLVANDGPERFRELTRREATGRQIDRDQPERPVVQAGEDERARS